MKQQTSDLSPNGHSDYMNSMCFRESGGQNLQKQKGSKKINGGATHSYLKETHSHQHIKHCIERHLWPQKALVLIEKEIAAEALDEENNPVRASALSSDMGKLVDGH